MRTCSSVLTIAAAFVAACGGSAGEKPGDATVANDVAPGDTRMDAASDSAASDTAPADVARTDVASAEVDRDATVPQDGSADAAALRLVLQEDSPAVCFSSGLRATTNAGYTGPGYLAAVAVRGADAAWLVHAGAAGTYRLTWRFASASSSRAAVLWLNHQDSGQRVIFATTASWADWAEQSITMTLPVGDAFVRLAADSAAGLPSIDSLTVEGPSPSAGTCVSYTPGAKQSWVVPQFVNQSVHDPSVIKAGDTYYVFGSHLAAARSKDLMSWSMVAAGLTATNPLFSNVLVDLKETLDWAQSTTLWAPDVRQLKSGKFLMYYNACKGDSPRSALGIASSSAVEGPYKNEGVILKSGMWGEISPDGTVYDATKHPNTVDPAVFYDAAGKLWMVYGSYSGGIFVMSLDSATGFPTAGQGYGKHLMGGNHARIEGGYVLLDPRSGYYYLFASFGGLAADGGYNIRVARSKTPDGPYLDSKGTSMATVKASFAFDDASIAPHAVKLMGNFQLTGAYQALGYVSPGHNSAYFDAAQNRYYLIFHTRFPGLGEAHEIRVHEMFINEDDWPVVSPLRYAPRLTTASPTGVAAAHEYVAPAEVPGQYQLVEHGRAISATIVQAVTVTLTASGTLSGAKTGKWRYSGQNRLEVTVDGRGVFKGVLSRQHNQAAGTFQVTFSGLNPDGEAVWGIRQAN